MITRIFVNSSLTKKTNQAAEIKKLKKRVKKLKCKKKKRTHGLKRLYKVGLSARIISSDEEGLGDQEDASKQERSITDIDQDKGTTLVDDTQGMMNEEDLFGVHDLDGDEVFVDVSAGEKEEQSKNVAKKEVSTADLITTDGKVVTTVDVEVSAAPTNTTTTDDELNLAQTLIEIKAAKPKAITTATTTVTDAKMVEPERPLKRKGQIIMDEQIARDLEAQMQADLEEEHSITKQKEEANIVMITEWDNTHAMMDQTDRVVEGSKKAKDEIEQESTKKQKLYENVQAEVADDDIIELKRYLEIVPEDDDDVAIKATPLSSKSHTIVDYKIYKEGKKSYFKIIRADGNSQNYLTFGKMFKNFNREDLEVLRSIVKERFKKIKPVIDMDNLLFQTLKTMFEHHIKDNIWKYQQGTVKIHNWKLYDSYGVYCVTTPNMVYYLLVEKMYPLQTIYYINCGKM
nr:hypothetical protein [Tanacetum cinerariifolium]GEW98893.1 hypothetical protein [Tanacetum cinerariifolium]